MHNKETELGNGSIEAANSGFRLDDAEELCIRAVYRLAVSMSGADPVMEMYNAPGFVPGKGYAA